ncbi:MAG: putative nitrogen regulatory PII-like protein [Nitrosopumilus sp.]|nr:putative nitrogen regulatory PII-like protein [Nitrosopumilus sp.]
MKKIEATIQATKISVASDAINDLVGGFSILEGNGRGSGERQTIRAGRGTGLYTAKFNKIAIITTIVPDTKVQEVTSAIADAVYVGSTGDGIITVSDVDSVTNISTKKTDLDAL